MVYSQLGEIGTMKLLRRWSVVESEQWKFFFAVLGLGSLGLAGLDVGIWRAECSWPVGQASHYLLSAIPQTLAALIGVSFAVLLVGFQMTSATFSKRAARLAISDPVVLTLLAAYLVTIIHSLIFLAFQKQLWPVSQKFLHAGCFSSLIGALACAGILAWVCWRVTRLLKLKGLLQRLERRLTALQNISFEQQKDLVLESRYLSVFTDLANSAIADRDPFVVKDCSPILHDVIQKALERTHQIRQLLSERSTTEQHSFVRDFAENHVRAGYFMISAADLNCAQIAGIQAGSKLKNPELAHRISSWWIEPGLGVLRDLANQGVLRSWGEELAWVFHYMRRVHRESALFAVREASVRWANELRNLMIYKDWKETLTQTACQLLTNITLFLHWCIDVRDMLPARGLLLGRAGLEQFDWPNKPLMKHWQDTGGYSGDRLLAFGKTEEHANLIQTIERTWAGFFDVGGHALYQALQEGKGSQVLADYLEMLCDAIRLEVNALTELKESFLEDVLTKALKIPHVNWDRVPGVHREPKSLYFPMFWAVLRVVLDTRGMWPAERMAKPSAIRENQRALNEGLGMFDREEGKEVARILVRNGILDSEEEIVNSIKRLKAMMKGKVAQQEKLVRDAVAKAPIIKVPPYLRGIRNGFAEALKDVRDVAQVGQDAQMSDFGPSYFRIPWGMEVERRFLVGDEVDPHRGYMMDPGEYVGEKIASAMLQGFLEEIAGAAPKREPTIQCKLNELAYAWAAEVKRLEAALGTTEFVTCPHIDLETAVFHLIFDLSRQERTDATIDKLQHWTSVRDSFKRLMNQEMLGADIDAVFFPKKRVGSLTIVEEPLQNIKVEEYTRDDGEPMVRFGINEPFKIDVDPALCFGVKITDLKRREKN